MNRKLLALLRGNAKKGEFRSESGPQGNVIYIYDVIVACDADAEWFGGVSAESFVKTLKGMTGDVELRINSPGGDVFGARAMVQAIRDHAGTITAHVDGLAASAASVITAAADKALMAPGSLLMIHKAWTIALGNADDFKSLAGVLDKIDGSIVADYAAAAGRRAVTAADFAALMAAETWFTADEAIAAGLADELAPDKSAAPSAKVDWDLSAYEHAPAAQSAPAPQADSVTVTVEVVVEDGDDAAAVAAALALAAEEQEDAERRRRCAAVALATAA